jgi:hypothetical protein
MKGCRLEENQACSYPEQIFVGWELYVRFLADFDNFA